MTGTINTSDEREKQQIREVAKKERNVAVKVKPLIRAFKYNDSVKKKGEGARVHFGVMAQDLKKAFESEGLRAGDYALLCYDEWEEEGEVKSRYGVRYEQLMAFILSAL